MGAAPMPAIAAPALTEINMTDLSKLTYGDHTVTLANLPEASRHWLMSRGFTHLLGNEIASRLTAWKGSDDGKDATEEAIAKKRAELTDTALARLEKGEMAVRTGGGGKRLSHEEKVRREVCVAMIAAAAKAKGVAMPEGKVLTEKVSQVYDRNKAKVDAQVAARLKAEAKLAEGLDIDI